MRVDLAWLVKLGLFICLALTLHRGFMKLPEIYPVLSPEQFYRGQVGGGESSLIMKERHYDYNYQIGQALALRQDEMAQRDENPPEDALVTRDRVERAIRKTLAKDERNADYVLLAREKLGRALRRQAQGWRMGWLSPSAFSQPGQPAQGAAQP